MNWFVTALYFVPQSRNFPRLTRGLQTQRALENRRFFFGPFLPFFAGVFGCVLAGSDFVVSTGFGFSTDFGESAVGLSYGAAVVDSAVSSTLSAV